jgi:hypothetical protein
MDSQLSHDKRLNPAKPKPRNFIAGFKQGAMFFLGDVASFNNFLLLSLTYFIGAGISALAMRIFIKSKPRQALKGITTYWSDIDIGEKSVDSYYRPF